MKKVIVAANVIVALVLTGAITLQGLADRQQTIEQGFRSAENLTQALAEQTRQLRNMLALGLGTVVEQFARLDREDQTDPATLHQLLVDRQAGSPMTYAYFVLDESGRLVATSRTPQPETLDLSHFPNFRVHQQDDADGEGMFLGLPRTGEVGYAEDQPVLHVSRRLSYADGSFAGTVTAVIALDYMLDFYRTLRSVDGDVVGLMNGEGQIIARSPFVVTLGGERYADSLVYTHLQGDTEAGRLIGSLRAADDRPRLIVYRTIPPTSLLVYVGLDQASVLAPWQDRLFFKIAIGLLALLLFLVASILGMRYLRTREEALAAEASARAAVETIFTSISDGVIVLDTDWRITYLNRKGEQLLQRSADDLLGEDFWESFPHARDSLAYDEHHRAVETGEPAVFDMYLKPLQAWFSVRSFPHEKGLTIYFHDITRRVEAEERLRQAQKMEAVGQLTGGVAHDFNNLLTVILGNAETMLEMLDPASGKVDTALRKQADLIRQAGQRAAELTHRLLAFARKQPLNPKLTNINELVGDAEELLRRTLHESIDVELVRATGLWKTRVDPFELQNAILNLAVNARDAMPEGGRLTIETANMAVDLDYAELNGMKSGQYVMVAVSDTGHGMAADVVERAFEPFFTTKAEGRGTGLGLSMVYGFVRQSGGHARIYSEPGQGTTVRLYLPRAHEKEEPQPATAQGELPGNPEGISGDTRILVVEDDELVRDYAVRSLERFGYSVHACADGQSALAALRDSGPFDLLLTDVVLAGEMSGRQVADQAARDYPDLGILYMSGYTDNAIVHHGRLDRGVQLLNKPFRLADLARKVREVLEARKAERG